ncbi:MAG: hypothetical protein FJX75_03670 [Armatimonadetes bacterium]|nr:hypothetical protein [Armatimonadota bacterium]
MGLVCPHCGEQWWRRPPDTGGIWALYLILPLVAIFGLAIFVGATVLMDAGGPHRAAQAPPGLRPLLVAIAYAVWSTGTAIVAAGACKAGPLRGQKDPDADPGPVLAGDLWGYWILWGVAIVAIGLLAGGIADLVVRDDNPYWLIGLLVGAAVGLLGGHLLVTILGTWITVRGATHRERQPALVPETQFSERRTCGRCGGSYLWHEADPQPLTQVEKLICAKEDLPFNRMKRITCPHCGTVSFSPEPE